MTVFSFWTYFVQKFRGCNLEGSIMKILVMMMGIPGSGKSTWVHQEIFAKNDQDFHYVSPDRYIEEKYDYNWTPKRAAEAWDVSYQRYGALLLNGQNIVWDATFLQRMGRSSVLHIAKGMGYYCKVVWVCCDLEQSLLRNQKRLRNPVPDNIIQKMWKNIEKPTDVEGFDEIVIVQT